MNGHVWVQGPEDPLYIELNLAEAWLLLKVRGIEITDSQTDKAIEELFFDAYLFLNLCNRCLDPTLILSHDSYQKLNQHRTDPI